jgi:hypothetical protein
MSVFVRNYPKDWFLDAANFKCQNRGPNYATRLT